MDTISFKLCRLSLALLLLGLSACGGGGGGDDWESELLPGNVSGVGWITIVLPTSSGHYTSDQPAVTLIGEAFASPTFVDCFGSHFDSGVSVAWHNDATAGVGAAAQEFSCSGTIVRVPSENRWTATVPLTTGGNLITVTASDPVGNVGKASIVVMFGTDDTAPTVDSILPVDRDTGVSTDTLVAATFSETMSASSLTADTFRLADENGNPVAGTVSYSSRTASLKPNINLAPTTRYVATLSSTVQDLAGNTLGSEFAWSFTTGVSTSITISTPGTVLPAPTTSPS